MRFLLVLIMFALSCNVAVAFAGLAAVLARGGSAWADPVGFFGLGLAGLAFITSSVFVWRHT